MKRIIYLFIFFFPLFLFAQKKVSKVKKFEVVQVLTPQKFYLNSSMSLQGRDVNFIKVVLPENTVEWFYSITTSKGKQSSQYINLFNQALKLYDPSGVTSLASELILTPSGNAPIDVYLSDLENKNHFVNRRFRLVSVMEGNNRTNFFDGTVKVTNYLNGDIYLLFSNPSSLYGVNVTLEVIAVVKK